MRRVDHHIHFFRDVSGLAEVWGIGPEKSSFVPFKPNLPNQPDMTPAVEGEYILCFGRSLRDFDTFLDAVERLPYPAAIPAPNLEHLKAHGARFTRPLDRLPGNVRLLPDDNTMEAQVQMLRSARIVVLPILKSSIVASGISTCLNAMLFGRCVVGSQGPGMSDIFQDEVLTCPPEDPEALAAVIGRAWEDGDLRSRTAQSGYRYAQRLGGEPELYQRIIDVVGRWCTIRRYQGI
jgi:glycosyltransferase involved in cell wall biosynthesis